MESHFRTIIYLDREKRIFTEANLVSVGGKKLNSVLRMSLEFHKGEDVAFTPSASHLAAWCSWWREVPQVLPRCWVPLIWRPDFDIFLYSVFLTKCFSACPQSHLFIYIFDHHEVGLMSEEREAPRCSGSHLQQVVEPELETWSLDSKVWAHKHLVMGSFLPPSFFFFFNWSDIGISWKIFKL